MSLVQQVTASSQNQDQANSLIVLIGLMGSGKTSVGRALAKKLGLKFFDSDELIEKSLKLSVREIFAQKGEPEFRRLESIALTEACSFAEPMVLAVAGGAVLQAENRTLLISRAKFVVWLDAPTSTLVGRTGRAKHRPLLDGDPVGALNQMRVDREDLYRQIATHQIATQSLSVNQVVERVIDDCDLTARELSIES